MRALPGANESMPAIHFGGSFCSPGAGRFFQVRAANTRKTAPKRICDHETPTVVALSDAASPATRAIPLTTASATAQPSANIGPLTLARLENSMRITAMIGTGLMATPMAKGRTAAIPSMSGLSCSNRRVRPGRRDVMARRSALESIVAPCPARVDHPDWMTLAGRDQILAIRGIRDVRATWRRRSLRSRVGRTSPRARRRWLPSRRRWECPAARGGRP